MKRILYLSTMPPPALSGTDAVLQEIETLKSRFGGEHFKLYPFRVPARWVPYAWMGLGRRKSLDAAVQNASILHVFSATLRALPCVGGRNRPVLYTVTASVGSRIPGRWIRENDVTFMVPGERDRQLLSEATGARVACIRPGLDLPRFSVTDLPPASPFRLLVGSAPWTRAQFRSKGIDALIETARRMPDLHLVFLWRNIRRADLERRLRRARIHDRVTVHDTRVDVNRVLAGCHASAVLADNERQVKAWPHSAIESLAAGRPVLLSAPIEMSAFVEEHRAGGRIETISAAAVADGIHRLRARTWEGRALRKIAEGAFPLGRFLADYGSVYEALSAGGSSA